MISLAVASPEGAVNAVRIEVRGELPFDREALDAAVSLRVPRNLADEDPVLLSAQGQTIEVTFRGRVRQVDVGRSADGAALRKVALAVADLLRDPVTIPLPPILAPAPAPDLDVGDLEVVQSAVTIGPPPERRPAPWSVSFVARAGVGDTLERPRFGAAADASIPIVGPLRATVAVGAYGLAPVRHRELTISYVGLWGELGVAFRPIDAVELRGGARAEPYFVGGGSRAVDVADRGVLPAASVEARYHFDVGAIDVVGALSATTYFRRRDFRVGGHPVLQTELVAVTLGLGVSFGGAQ